MDTGKVPITRRAKGTARSIRWRTQFCWLPGWPGHPHHGQAIRDFVRKHRRGHRPPQLLANTVSLPCPAGGTRTVRRDSSQRLGTTEPTGRSALDAETGKLTAAGQANQCSGSSTTPPISTAPLFVHRAGPPTQETASHINTVEQFVTQVLSSPPISPFWNRGGRRMAIRRTVTIS